MRRRRRILVASCATQQTADPLPLCSMCITVRDMSPGRQAKDEQVNFRVSAGEKAAIEALVRRRHEEQGDDGASGWFRWIVRREARAAGIEIVEPGEGGAPTSAAPEPAKKPTPKSPKVAPKKAARSAPRMGKTTKAKPPQPERAG